MKQFFFILLAAAIVALPVTVSCKKVELPAQEEAVEETEEPETPETPDPDSQNGGQNSGNTPEPGNGGDNNGSDNGSSSNENPIENAKALRTWTVDFCILEISGNGISLMAGFKGCDIEEIARMAEKNGAKIDFSKIAGYKMSEISLYDNDVLAITFENKEVFYGKYTLNGKNIVYTFTSGGKDLQGKTAGGTLTYPAAKEAVLTLKTTINEYSGSIELDMTEK